MEFTKKFKQKLIKAIFKKYKPRWITTIKTRAIGMGCYVVKGYNVKTIEKAIENEDFVIESMVVIVGHESRGLKFILKDKPFENLLEKSEEDGMEVGK